MALAVQIVAILFMITLIVISILLCVTASQAHRQLRYQNYLLEKLTHNIHLLVNKDTFSSSNSDKKDNEDSETDKEDIEKKSIEDTTTLD